jgi:hypothetical protein
MCYGFNQHVIDGERNTAMVMPLFSSRNDINDMPVFVDSAL